MALHNFVFGLCCGAAPSHGAAWGAAVRGVPGRSPTVASRSACISGAANNVREGQFIPTAQEVNSPRFAQLRAVSTRRVAEIFRVITQRGGRLYNGA